jgi:hypothetical protein
VRRAGGGALAVVLAVVSILLLAGLALGTLATLSLNLSRQSYLHSRCLLLARSGTAEFIARVARLEASRPLELGRTEPLDLAAHFPDTQILPGCRVAFDPGREFHSVDNSLSELPAQSWFDRGTSRHSVPPFTVELVLTVELEGQREVYRALLQRIWPFAAYARRGAVALAGTPDLSGGTVGYPAPTLVKGAVYCGFDGLRGDLPWAWPGVGGRSPAERLANLEAGAWTLDLKKGPFNLVSVGEPLSFVPPRAFKRPLVWRDAQGVQALPMEVPAPGRAAAWVVSTENWVAGDLVYDGQSWVQASPARVAPGSYADQGNVLEGDAAFPYLEGTSESFQDVSVGPASAFRGRVRRRVQVPDPLSLLQVPDTTSGFVAVEIPLLNVEEALSEGEGGPEGKQTGNQRPTGSQGGRARGAKVSVFIPPIRLLTEDLRLSPAENSSGGPTGTRYVLRGSVGNRVVLEVRSRLPSQVNWPVWALPDLGVGGGPSGAGSQGLREGDLVAIEYGAGLELRDCVLVVEGDLDLGASTGDRQPALVGSNATLIVKGNLTLSGGRLDAKDKGMVIYARNIMTRAAGDYRGLLVTPGSLCILPSEAGHLKISGGLVCGAYIRGLFLRSVELRHDPRYLKVLHGLGEFRVTGWQRK